MTSFHNTHITFDTMSDNNSHTSALTNESLGVSSEIQGNDHLKLKLIKKYSTGKTLDYNKSTM